jgi:membrane-anchored mycosin MYCP
VTYLARVLVTRAVRGRGRRPAAQAWWRTVKRGLVAGVVGGLVMLLSAAPAMADTTAVPQLPTTGQGCVNPPSGMYAGIPWAQQRLALQRVWPMTTGTGVVVAVVDTGVDARTPQLAGRVLAGQDLTARGPGNNDCYGHGTFVAGIIAAAEASGTKFAGVAPSVTILPIRVASSADGGSPDVMAAGIRQAVAAGATVINVSASTNAPNANLAAAISDAVANNVVVVAAAGNDQQTGDPRPYPAAYPGVLAVGAVDAGGALADFSQTGSYLGLTAPGVNVVSIGPGGPGHWEASGTSYAAPFVSGVAALVRAYRPRLTAAEVVHRLEATAIRPAASVPDPGFGWGMVDPLAAVTQVLPEEGAGGARVLAPPNASAAGHAAADERGPLVVVAALFVVAGVGGLALLVTRMGWRGWRPARVLRSGPDTTQTGISR